VRGAHLQRRGAGGGGAAGPVHSEGRRHVSIRALDRGGVLLCGRWDSD
jgi:hypothetical protein